MFPEQERGANREQADIPVEIEASSNVTHMFAICPIQNYLPRIAPGDIGRSAAPTACRSAFAKPRPRGPLTITL